MQLSLDHELCWWPGPGSCQHLFLDLFLSCWCSSHEGCSHHRALTLQSTNHQPAILKCWAVSCLIIVIRHSFSCQSKLHSARVLPEGHTSVFTNCDYYRLCMHFALSVCSTASFSVVIDAYSSVIFISIGEIWFLALLFSLMQFFPLKEVDKTILVLTDLSFYNVE